MPIPTPRLYTDLSEWWHLLSSPADYDEEAAFFVQTLRAACSPPPQTLLELGSGGGNNAFHLKKHFRLTLVDPAPGMLAQSQRINPECEHLAGDMRSLRLGRSFDAVLIHDAIVYMTSEADLLAALATAFAHLRPGGPALFTPDHTRESFNAHTDHGGEDIPGGRGVRYVEWVYDPDPTDSTYHMDFAYLLREADGSLHAEADRHVCGLFGEADWLRLMAQAGFQAHALDDDFGRTVFVGVRPQG